MGPAAVQLLLESVLVPFVFAGLVLISARWVEREWLGACMQALAILIAVAMTYVLAFGWPADLASGARSKIMFAAIGGLVIGAALEGRGRWTRAALVASAIIVPLWIGLPAMEQGRLESALLIFPIGMALTAPFILRSATGSSGQSEILIATTMAVGLGAIAVIAKALSYAELCLALGSALFAILTIGQKPLAAPAAALVTATLLALATALLLYSKASLPALLVLGWVIGAERLARLVSGDAAGETAKGRVAIFCALPLAAAILIARIDAGPFSIY